MTALNLNNSHPRISEEWDDLGTPVWAAQVVGEGESRRQIIDGLDLSISVGPNRSLITIRLADAVSADSEALESQTINIYGLLQRTLTGSLHQWPVRLWNFLPAIHQRMDTERDHYMVFNSGRFKAYCQWWGGRDMLPEHVPTASAVGHSGADLVVHCLTAEKPGQAVENPRQIPAFGYSRRFGPLPPCFSRGTLIDGQLLVGGTASICGEQSMHLGQLAEQTEETLTNIATLVRAAAGRIGIAPPDDSAAFGAFSSLRVFHPVPTDRTWIETSLRRRFTRVSQIEFARADLCRPELLVEIEGVATLG